MNRPDEIRRRLQEAADALNQALEAIAAAERNDEPTGLSDREADDLNRATIRVERMAERIERSQKKAAPTFRTFDRQGRPIRVTVPDKERE
jgi:Mg2+ and Co2+ transporter CorA